MRIFISDLHLDSATPQLTNHFCRFLNELKNDINEIYILGDLFETWIGDDDINPHHSQIIAALSQLNTRNIKLYLQHGNRDFLLSKQFAEATKAIILQDEHIITVANKRILLMHGDLLCEKDISYQKMRKILRNPFIKFCLLKLPLSFRKKIAQQLRLKSQSYNQEKLPEIMDVVQEAVVRFIKKHDADLLIHGHTHHQDMVSFIFNNKNIQRIILPAWHNHADALVLMPDASLNWLPIF